MESDEDIAALLAGESLKGPRAFRGRKLAPITRTLKRLMFKVGADDFTALHILAEAHALTEDGQFEKLRALIAATDDSAAFRAAVGMQFDKLSDAEEEETHRLMSEILGVTAKAEVAIVTAEKKSTVPAAPSLTSVPLPSSPSPESSPAEVQAS